MNERAPHFDVGTLVEDLAKSNAPIERAAACIGGAILELTDDLADALNAQRPKGDPEIAIALQSIAEMTRYVAESLCWKSDAGDRALNQEIRRLSEAVSLLAISQGGDT